jgi:hypothetical protein
MGVNMSLIYSSHATAALTGNTVDFFYIQNLKTAIQTVLFFFYSMHTSTTGDHLKVLLQSTINNLLLKTGRKQNLQNECVAIKDCVHIIAGIFLAFGFYSTAS